MVGGISTFNAFTEYLRRVEICGMHFSPAGVHQLDAARQEVSKSLAGKLPHCLRGSTDKAPHHTQEVRALTVHAERLLFSIDR